jgi:hypothetical protein
MGFNDRLLFVVLLASAALVWVWRLSSLNLYRRKGFLKLALSVNFRSLYV